MKALQDMVMAVSMGQMPRESAVATIAASFRMTAEQADELLGSAGKGFVPTKDE